MSDYKEDEELDDFIVSDEEVPSPQEEETEAPQQDRITGLTTMLRVNESFTSKVLRAHISVLVSALGGPDHSSEDGLYKLGHDALACLKDIKKWIRSVDDRNNSSEVALACAENGLVNNDLTVILCQWDKPPPGVKRTKTTDKIMLACLELLVLLTWPIEVNRKTLLKDYTSKTNARRAQLVYKKHILAYQGGHTLKAIIRLGLRAMQLPREDREPRDVNILRLILFFIRNLLFIEPLPASKSPKAITNSSDLPNGMSPEDVGLNAVIAAFENNKVLLFLTSIAHSVLSEFNDETFGVLVIECLSLLTRGIKTESLFSTIPKAPVSDISENVPPASSAAGLQLQDLLSEEEKRKRRQKNTVSTRHGRFGTLLSIQSSDNSSYYTISGQEALASTLESLDKLDRTKKWHKTSGFKYDSNEYVKNSTIYLNLHSIKIIKRFIDLLLSSGSYNNLLLFVGRHLTNISNDHDLGRKGILDSVDPHELASYFLVISWFFSYKRDRNNYYARNKLAPLDEEDSLDYGSVGSSLSEINFILLTSYLRSAYEAKDYDSLHVALICMRGMLQISNAIFSSERTQREMNPSSEEDINHDRELAEGIIRKLFSQKQFLDMIVNIPRQASRHSPEYLSVVVSVVHIVLKCFETLANEDVKLYIQGRRRVNKLGNQSGLNHDMDRQHWHLIDAGSDEEDFEQEIRYINQERKLDFKNTEVRFFHTETVSTHIAYLSRFEDLTHEEIKRGISFFHRLFVVRKDFAALYRLDFMNLLYRLRAYLPRSSNIRRHVDDFIVYFMKKFKTALDRFPVAIELLFPRFENLEMKGFLSTGDLESTSTSSSIGVTSARGLPKSSYFSEDAPQPRAAAILRFNDDNLTLDEKIGVLIYHLIKKKNGIKILKFLIGELERLTALKEKGINNLMLRLNLTNRKLLINEPHLRLLVESIGFDLPFLQNDETSLKTSVEASTLVEAKNSIDKWLKLHEEGVGDIEPFLDQVHQEIFTKEQLNFGIIALSDVRSGRPIDLATAEVIGLRQDQIGKLFGLAKRKEYDEMVAAQYALEDEDYDIEPSDAEDNSSISGRRRKRMKNKSSETTLLDSVIDDLDDLPKKQRRSRREILKRSLDSDDDAPVKSSEMVNDSDDESDDEKVKSFYEKEEQLRQLISLTGGIMNKTQLEIFKESWQKIVNTNEDSQVKTAISRAASLFVDDLDENDDELQPKEFSHQNTTDELQLNQKRTQDEGHVMVSRKRRIVLEEEDEE